MLRLVEIGPEMLGGALPWDLFDQHGVFLVPRGTVVSSQEQLERLRGRRLYINVAGKAAAGGEGPASPIDNLEAIRQQLEQLLPRMLLVPGAPEIVLEQAARLCQACDADIDAALGWTRLSRQGRQSVRHVMHVAMVTHLLARECFGAGEGDVMGLIAAALTMNVGAMELHDQLVDRGGNLSAPVRESIRQHPQRGAAILQACGIKDGTWIEAVRQHHETPDGAGYPRGLAADEIHPYARVLKVADIYCARLESPYYRFPSPRAAVRETFGRQREHLDPRLTSALFRLIGVYHPGILVRLANQEIGVIVRRGLGGMPSVLGIMGARGKDLFPPQLRDISQRQHALRGCVAYDEIRPRLDLNQLWGYAGAAPA